MYCSLRGRAILNEVYGKNHSVGRSEVALHTRRKLGSKQLVIARKLAALKYVWLDSLVVEHQTRDREVLILLLHCLV